MIPINPILPIESPNPQAALGSQAALDQAALGSIRLRWGQTLFSVFIY
jgi:hypothetical protein